MTRALATQAQRVPSKLVNRLPVRCAVCDRFVGPLIGLPVILNDKEQIIQFAHPECITVEN